MSDARETGSTHALTADDRKFLEAIKRTQQETSLPAGMKVDISAIAAKAFASYSEVLPRDSTELTNVLSRATDGLNKAVAELLDQQQHEHKVQFRREFSYSVVPTSVLIVLGIGYLLLRSRVNLPYTLLVQLLAGFIALAAIALYIGFRFVPERLSSGLRQMRYSSGAMVGGLAAALICLQWISYNSRGWQQEVTDTKLQSTSRAMAEVGFATVGANENENLAERTRMNFVGLDNSDSFELTSDKPAKKVEVKAKPGNVATSVVLMIEPFKADVYSVDSAEPDYQILTGKVNSVSDNHIEIKPNDASVSHPIRINLATASLDQPVLTQLRDKEVKVLFVPKSSQAIKMAFLGKGSDSIIYNAASPKLLDQSAAIVR